MAVARAAPATPIPNTATKTRSSTIFTRQVIIKRSRVALLFPSPLNIPAFKLYPIFPRQPNVVILRYSTAPSMASAGTFISFKSQGPASTPTTERGTAQRYKNHTAVEVSLPIRFPSFLPMAWETRIEIPDPIPRKMQSRISNG